MQPDPHAVQIRVDGSCFVDEDRRSGYAGYVLWPDSGVEERIVFEGFRESTINRMELAACIAAMDWVCDARPSASRVQVFSDSRYVIDNIPRAPFWHKGRNAQGRPVENFDLWKKFISTRGKTGVRVDFGWVKGKSTPLLKVVDRAAKEAAKSGTAFDRGYIVGKLGRARHRGAATMFPAAGQVLTIRECGSKVVGKTAENRITFELYDTVTNRCGAKHFAYAQPAVGAELHRHHAYRVQMNDKPKYPQILRVLEEIPLPKAVKKLPSSQSGASSVPAAKS